MNENHLTHTEWEKEFRWVCFYHIASVLSHFSGVQLFATLWTVALQAPLPTSLSRQGYWKRFLCSPPGELSDPGTEPASLMSPALAADFFTTSATWEAPTVMLEKSYVILGLVF